MRIPTITKNLLIINVLAFLAMMVLQRFGINLNDICGLHFFLAPDFQVYQLVTYMFMHAGWQHIIFNMFALWMFGCVVERVWGPKKFLFYYIFTGVGAGILQEIVQFAQLYYMASEQLPAFSFSDIFEVAHNSSEVLNQWTTVGASGAVYAILLAFGMIFPEERIFIFPLPIPIKAKWFVVGYVVIELFSALSTPGDSVAHFAHLGGMLFGFLLIRYWYRHPSVDSSQMYGRSSGEHLFSNLRSRWEQHQNRKTENYRDSQTSTQTSTHESDWEYNARQAKEQDEVDRILDKIRRSGYDCLTTEEKQKLFNQSNRK